MFYHSGLQITRPKFKALKVLLPCHISVHHVQHHPRKKQLLQFSDPTQIIFTQLPVESLCTAVWFLPLWDCLLLLFMWPEHFLLSVPMPSAIRHLVCWGESPCFSPGLPDPQDTPSFTNWLICPHLSEVLCLLTISWRNDQVNHQF